MKEAPKARSSILPERDMSNRQFQNNNEDSRTDSLSLSPSESVQDKDPVAEYVPESPQTAFANRPGRKKNPNSVAARRDQNRIAQREFRLRKQQRIRDLEAHVEILTSSRNDGYHELKLIIKDLIKENATLRRMVKELSNFLGGGEGGFVNRLGMDWEEFSKFINKADTDTAYEGWATRREAHKSTENHAESSRKRNFSGDGPEPPRKRVNSQGASHAYNHSDDRIGPISIPSPNLPSPWSPLTNLDGGQGLHNLLDLRPSPLHPMVPGPSSFDGVTSLSSHASHFPDPPSASNQTPVSHVRPASPPPPLESDTTNQILDMKIQEAIKLVRYHLDNYRRNDAYCLPPSLRPSLVQRTVPHESMIDEIVNPDLRDSMILLRGRYDLVECLHLASSNLEVHGEDVLAHYNWEFKEPWLRTYGFLVEQPLLNVCNRWRRERGEQDLTLADVRSGECEKLNEAV